LQKPGSMIPKTGRVRSRNDIDFNKNLSLKSRVDCWNYGSIGVFIPRPFRAFVGRATALKTADGKKSTLLAARRVTVTEGRYVGPGCLSNHRLQVSCPLIFVLIMAVWVVCGCIFTRKPRKKLPAETARPAVLQERQPGCFALEEERGGHWTASSVPVIKEELGRVCNQFTQMP
jgi:hypothetical protein